MIAWLLSWFFPFAVLLPRARSLGAVTFQTVEGVGWQCTIRPPLTQVYRRGAINSWSGQGASMSRALRRVLSEVEENPTVAFAGDPRHAPKLGGAEFDDE